MSNKAQARVEADDLVAQYLARGGRIDRAPTTESGNGFTGKDWARAEQGLKVATGEEVAAERERRAIIALKNDDTDLLVRILQFEFDKEIKFDIENELGGPRDYRELKEGKSVGRVVVRPQLPTIVADAETPAVTKRYRLWAYVARGKRQLTNTPDSSPRDWLLALTTTDQAAFRATLLKARERGVVVHWVSDEEEV